MTQEAQLNRHYQTLYIQFNIPRDMLPIKFTYRIIECPEGFLNLFVNINFFSIFEERKSEFYILCLSFSSKSLSALPCFRRV